MENKKNISPSIILVRPQMHENIGATARAMANFAFTDLRLVSPRDGKPSDKAYAMSSGATDILDNAKIFDNVANSVSDITYLIGTTARNRDINKPVLSPSEAVNHILFLQNNNNKCGFMFGPERTGLENSDLLLCDAYIYVPVNPQFASLNLAQCVLLIAYEYFQQINQEQIPQSHQSTEPLATKKDMDYMTAHLIDELDKAGFFYPAEKRNASVQLISNIFTRANLTEQEVRTLRGVIKALTTNRYPS